ncbi:hypothetical protein GCM10023185_41060 [Hymenobacter saemangeumensis]|uniref:HTH araC/xylS-type domain-containing protein n=1 Tax=Hymenobacter saemangeumensis TaxID=1084522 RepID=A0ABP8IRB8_9BACT
MLRTQFPDISELKRNIALRFAEGRGWPSVVLNVQTTGTVHRPDIVGPLTLFSNRRGGSAVAVHGRRVQLEADGYFLSNQGEAYTLDVAAPGTETLNVHFGQQLAETAWRDLSTADQRLLDDPFGPAEQVCFFGRVYEKDPVTAALLDEPLHQGEAFNHHATLREEWLLRLLARLLHTQRAAFRRLEALPAVKAATRQEVYRRLSYSLDYLHSYYAANPSLDELAQVACLSKFHYLRLFRAVYGQTPYHYLRRLRLQKAAGLLGQRPPLPVAAIAELVGFESSSAFCRAFHAATGAWPQAFQQQGTISNFGQYKA